MQIPKLQPPKLLLVLAAESWLVLTWGFWDYIIQETKMRAWRRKMASGPHDRWFKNCWKLLRRRNEKKHTEKKKGILCLNLEVRNQKSLLMMGSKSGGSRPSGPQQEGIKEQERALLRSKWFPPRRPRKDDERWLSRGGHVVFCFLGEGCCGSGSLMPGYTLQTEDLLEPEGWEAKWRNVGAMGVRREGSPGTRQVSKGGRFQGLDRWKLP
jgi:hypothetical protein